MKNETGSNAWRLWGAIVLVILLILLWLLDHGPRNSCCADSSTVAAAPAAITETPILADYKDGKLTLTGEVGSAEFKQGLLDAAAKAVGAENVIDALTVNADAKENDVLLTGVVPTEADEDRIEDAFETVIGIEDLDDEMTVAEAAVTPLPAAMPVTCTSAITLDVTFDSASAVIASSGKAQLDEAVKCITTATEIAGFTDNTGDAVSNKTLSLARADAVKAYLVEKGIAPDLLTTVGNGQENPIADNATAEGRAQNRRIVLNAK